MEKEKYCSWTIDGSSTTKELDGVQLAIPLVASTDGIVAEGYWPREFFRAETVISGICLWDWRWQVEFAGQGKNPGAKRTLASLYERDDVYKKLARGKKLLEMRHPVDMGAYHRLFIPWLVKKLCVCQSGKLLFQIPEMEYLGYLTNLEKASGLDLAEAKADLRLYASMIKTELEAEIANSINGGLEIIYIDPMLVGAKDDKESFLYPYLFPEKFGVNREGLVGIEDLVEVALSICASKQTGIITPVLCGVLGLPNPYFDKAGYAGLTKTSIFK
jgi:hypothetical protein